MKTRTIDDIDEEIAAIELDILDVKKTIHEDGPDWREVHRRKTRDIGPGYVPLAERRKRVTVLEGRVARLQKERTALLEKLKPSAGKKFGHGKLKQRVQDLAHSEGHKAGKTIPSTVIAKWRRELEKDGYQTSEGSIRAVLSSLGYTKEGSKKG